MEIKNLPEFTDCFDVGFREPTGMQVVFAHPPIIMPFKYTYFHALWEGEVALGFAVPRIKAFHQIGFDWSYCLQRKEVRMKYHKFNSP